jgi:hypothetical protein
MAVARCSGMYRSDCHAERERERDGYKYCKSVASLSTWLGFAARNPPERATNQRLANAIGLFPCRRPVHASHLKNPIVSSQSHKHSSTQLTTPTPALLVMASLSSTSASRAVLRTLSRTSLSSLPVRALSTSTARCRASATDSSFDSPFRGLGGDKASKIPDFSHYRSKQGSNSNLVFQYFMVGTMGALTAAGAKATVQGTFQTFTRR